MSKMTVAFCACVCDGSRDTSASDTVCCAGAWQNNVYVKEKSCMRAAERCLQLIDICLFGLLSNNAY